MRQIGGGHMTTKRQKNYPRIRGLMAERNITQDELADILGIARSTFNKKINSDKDILTLRECKAIAKFFSLSLDDIFMPESPKIETKAWE